MFLLLKWAELCHKLVGRHGILHEPSASIDFWQKSFHKSSAIFNIFAKQIMHDFWHFWHGKVNCAIFLISGVTRSTEYKIQLQTILMLLQHAIHLAHCGTWFILPPVFRKISEHSFRIVENLYWNFIVIFTIWKLQLYLPHCGKYQVLSIVWKLSVFLPQNYLTFYL